MKIENIRVFVLKQDLVERFAFSQWWHVARQACIIRITTDQGITGWGEANAPADAVRAMIESIYAPLLLGQDPLNTQALWEMLYTRAKVFGPGAVTMGALSAVDIALWDIKARSLGVPIYQLLGGQTRSSVRAYATGFFRRDAYSYPDAFVDEALGHVAEGFRALKIKVGTFGLDDDLRNVQAVHAATQTSQVTLMVDANGAYEDAQAQSLGSHLAELGICWFEEPLPKSNMEGYRDLRAKVPIPLAGGETLTDRFQFREWIHRRSLDIIQPDACRVGGFTECQRIVALAQSFDVRVVLHVWGTGIAIAAALQLLAAIPDYPTSLQPPPVWLECDTSPNPLRDSVLERPLAELHGGNIYIPAGDGLGVTVNQQFLENSSPT